jgi:membrane fusion protein, multidrug efflux system
MVNEANDKPPDEQPGAPRRHGRLRAVWILVGVLVVAALAWMGFGRRSSRAAHPPAPPVSVVAAPVQTGDIDVKLRALGTVSSLATVTVMSQINGQLQALGFHEGTIVTKGDFLAQIDPRPYEVALQKDLGQLARDKAALDGARVDLVRYERLNKLNSIARQQYEDQLAIVRQDEGTVEADQGLVASDRLNLAYCRIVAPVTGLVGIRQVDVGNYVQTSNTNGIVVITQLQPISVLFTIPEDQLPQVWQRFRQGVALQAQAYDRVGNKLLATGKLVATDSQINTSTGTVQLRAWFDNPGFALFPNQFVNIELLVDVLHGAVVAPAAAVQQGTPGAYVYLVQPDRTVRLRTVKTGTADGERVAILSGLKPGDQVVVDGADKLRDGARIALPAAGGGHGR